MADTKLEFVAVRGIDFEKFGRVEPGEPIPAKLDAGTLKDLLDNGDIQQKPKEAKK